jgi:crossover junction endodeoxyribonuclease RusA
MSTVELVLPYPVSANRYWASRIVKSKATGRQIAVAYVTPEAVEYRDHVVGIARAAGIRKPIVGRVSLELELYPLRPLDFAQRMRKRGELWDDDVRCIDLDNASKVVSDSLEAAKVISNDNRFWRIELQRMEPDGVARCVVRVKSVVTETPQAALL